jgi:omega-6 fatty acid desaturase (delta-12 desaturase)
MRPYPGYDHGRGGDRRRPVAVLRGKSHDAAPSIPIGLGTIKKRDVGSIAGPGLGPGTPQWDDADRAKPGRRDHCLIDSSPILGNEEPMRDISSEGRHWPRALAKYRDPDVARSTLEIVVTVLPLIALWVVMWGALQVSPWLCLPLAVPAAAFLVRLFMIQHDCSHGSFFRRRATNDWVGRILGVVTLTPHDLWRRTHAIHHAGMGNLDERGIGDVTTLTVAEYLSRGRWRRLVYRIYRHPAMLFGVGPSYLFLLQHRLPVGLMRRGWQPWISTMATNLAIAAIAAGVVLLLGSEALLLILLPTAMLAASAGVWLFYVQHQFENTYWEGDDAWSHAESSLRGSSYYVLPGILRWLTANIGMHHVHHLNSRIPFYRLPEVLEDHPVLDGAGRLTLWESFGCVRLTLWDERRKRLVAFDEAMRAA